MSAAKIVWRVALGVVAVLIALAVAAVFLLPRLVDQQALCERLSRRLAEVGRAQVRCDSLRLAFLPWPHIRVVDVRLAVPGKGTIEVPVLTVWPKLLPVLRGEVRMGSLRLQEASITVHWPTESPGPNPAEETASLERLESILDGMFDAASDLTSSVTVEQVELTDGRAQIVSPGGAALLLEELAAWAQIEANQLQIEGRARSPRWEKLWLRGSLDSAQRRGAVRVEVTGVQARSLAMRPSEGPLALQDFEGDVRGQAAVQGSRSLQATLELDASAIVLLRGEEETMLRGARLDATAEIDDLTVRIGFDRLRVDSPAMQVSGRLQMAPDGTTLDARGEDLDVAAVREAFLRVTGNGRPAHQVFEVLRGGTVPEIEVHSRAASPRQLADDDALTLRGRLQEGWVRVPEVELDFRDVSGDARVTGGILSGEGVAARLSGSTASDARFRVGLRGEPRQLSVTAPAEADAADMADLLERLVDNPTLHRVLDHLHDVRGAAGGTLRLDGTTRNLDVQVDAPSFDLSARVAGMNERWSVRGGPFHYDGARVEVERVEAHGGESSLGDLSLRIAMDQEPASFEVGVGPSRLQLDELIPWLIASGQLPGPEGASASGTVSLRALRIGGAWGRPAKWRVERAGLSASDLRIPIREGQALEVPHLALEREDEAVDVGVRLSIGGERVAIDGRLQRGDPGWTVDLDLAAGKLDWKDIEPILPRGSPGGGQRDSLRGTVRVRAESFTFGGFTWQGIRGMADLTGNGFVLEIESADLCGIATPGTIEVDAQGVSLAFRPMAKNEELDRLAVCTHVETQTTGRYALEGKVRAGATAGDLARSLDGTFRLRAEEGRVHEVGTVGRIFSLLSTATGGWRSLGEISREGLAYDRIEIRARLRGSQLLFEEAILDGPSLTCAAQGTLDVTSRELDLTLLVSPLTTANTVVQHIPIVDHILGGSIASYPVRVGGTLDDPRVNPLSPTAVGESLIGIMKRTLELPGVVLEPLLPEAEEGD